MNIRQLKIYVAVCDLRSFTAAAKALYMTQPAISHVIHDLEAEVGTALLERTPKNINLTQAGLILFEKAKHLLSIYDDLEKVKSNLDELAPLRIGSCITVAHSFLIQLTETMKQAYPNLQMPVTIASAAVILDKLEKNDIDAAFIEGAFPHEKFNSVQLDSYKIIPVCSPSFITTDNISLQELIKQPLLLREKGSAIRDVFDSELFLRNIEIQPLWTSTNSNVLMKAAVQGIGIALLPENMILDKIRQGQLKRLKIEDVILKNQNHLIYNRYKQLNTSMNDLIIKAKALCNN